MSKYLTIDNGRRDTKFPILHRDLWENYLEQRSNIWAAEEVDLGSDTLEGIPTNEREMLKNLLAFFGVSDTLVQDNLNDEIVAEFSTIEELKSLYTYINYIEDVHSETYSLLIEALFTNINEKDEMFRAIETNPIVAKKVAWAQKWLNDGDIIQRVVAFSLLEGMGFSSTFAMIMFFRLRYPQLTGLGQANELILQDEVLHMHTGINLYKKYVKPEYKLDPSVIREMILDCYETEKAFVLEIYGDNNVPGMPKDKTIQYIQYVTDSLLGYYDLEYEFKVSQPFDFMASFSIVERNNFFEVKTGEYSRLENIGGSLRKNDF